MCPDWELIPWAFALQDDVQQTKPHWSGPCVLILSVRGAFTWNLDQSWGKMLNWESVAYRSWWCQGRGGVVTRSKNQKMAGVTHWKTAAQKISQGKRIRKSHEKEVGGKLWESCVIESLGETARKGIVSKVKVYFEAEWEEGMGLDWQYGGSLAMLAEVALVQLRDGRQIRWNSDGGRVRRQWQSIISRSFSWKLGEQQGKNLVGRGRSIWVLLV